MNILIINTNNPLVTSGNVGLDLFNGFTKKGHQVKLLVNQYGPDYPEGIICMETYFLFAKKKIQDKISRSLKLIKSIKKDSNYHFHKIKEQKVIYQTKALLKKANFENVDAIIVLFAKDFINMKNIYELSESTHAPVYWLMYDMAPLTGGCHYAWDCVGYQNQCGKCPGLFSSDPYDVTFTNLEYKKKYIDKTNVQLIAASEWQNRQAKLSSLFRNKTIHKILLSVDSSVFKPVHKERLRLEMGISITKKVIFFGSVYLSQLRKGMYFLLESLKILKEKVENTKLENNIILLIAGNQIDEIVDSLPFEYHYLGFLNNTNGIASAYQASDVFLCPSIEDSGPSMINQSVMCGTPVVSFEMGVSLDLVISGKTGYRAKLKDSADMAQGLFTILNLEDHKYKVLSDSCRKLALELCSPEVQMYKLEDMIKKNKH